MIWCLEFICLSADDAGEAGNLELPPLAGLACQAEVYWRWERGLACQAEVAANAT